VCLPQLIPSPPPRPVGAELPTFHQGAEVLLQRIATTASEPDGVGHGDAAMLTRELDDLQRQLRQCRQHQLLALDLPVQAPDLLGQRMQKEASLLCSTTLSKEL
jgi:hypothetical protein